MLTGSLAGSYHGAPRSTQDIDLVVEASVAALLEVATKLRTHGLCVSDDAIREAHAARGMFNAVDPDSGWKVDFIVRKDRPFSRAEFESRREIEFLGLELSIASAEDDRVLLAISRRISAASSSRTLLPPNFALRCSGINRRLRHRPSARNAAAARVPSPPE